MTEILCVCGIILTAYLIFLNVGILQPYAEYVSWILIGCIALFAIVAIVTAVMAIVRAVQKKDKS